MTSNDKSAPVPGADSTSQTIKTDRPKCTEDQRAKVTAAINAYVQAAQAAQAPAPKAGATAPLAGSPN